MTSLYGDDGSPFDWEVQFDGVVVAHFVAVDQCLVEVQEDCFELGVFLGEFDFAGGVGDAHCFAETECLYCLEEVLSREGGDVSGFPAVHRLGYPTEVVG